MPGSPRNPLKGKQLSLGCNLFDSPNLPYNPESTQFAFIYFSSIRHLYILILAKAIRWAGYPPGLMGDYRILTVH